MSDLDTALVPRAGGLEARNALVDARFGQSVGQGVQLEGGIGVRFAGVAGETEAQVDGDKAFYAATMPATDQTLVATPDGLEVLWQLRGRDAPEQFGLDFALPPGAKLRLVREARRPVRVEVFRGKDVLVVIRAPAAWDAEDQPIPVEYVVAGSRLTVKVSHRDRDALYPIAVDPTFVLENWIHRNGDYSANWQTDPTLDFLGWAPTTFWGSPEFYQGFGYGLWVGIGDQFDSGHGEWRWRPPGNARVFRAEYAPYSYSGYGGCVQEGIKSSSNGWWATTVNGAPGQPLQPSGHPCAGPAGYQIYCLQAQPCGPQGGSPGDFAVFGASREYPEYERSDAYLPGAAVFVADLDRPYFTQADVWENQLDDANWSFEQDQANWRPIWADGGSYTIPPRVHGDRHYSIRRRTGEGIAGYALSAAGAVPAQAGRSYRASFSARPEAGVRPALARAELFFLNAAGQELARQYGPWARETTAPDWRRVPEVRAQAPVGTASVVMHMAWSEMLDWQWHNADAAMLEAVCTEGCANRWTKSAKRYVNTVATDDGLGANRIRLSRAARTGGTATDSRTHPCAGNRFDYCPAPYNRDGVGFNQTFQINTDDLPEGSTELNATTTDVTDNESTRNIPVKIDRTPPQLDVTGTLKDADDDIAPNAATGRVTATDGSASAPRSGVRSIEILVDDNRAFFDSQACDQSCTYAGAGRSLTLTVAATDGDASQPSTQRSGVASISATLDGQPIAGGSASQSCTRPEGSCPLTLNATLTAAQLDDAGAGRHTVVVTAKDAVGNESPPRSFEFDYDPAEPTLQLRGSLADFDGQVLTEDSYNLELHALDTDEEVYGAGLAGVEVKLDGLSQTTSPIDCHDVEHCEQARSYTWNTTAAANGDHTITVTATDRAGNITTETIDVELARPTQQPPRTATDQRMTINGGAGDQAGTAVTALGDLNDDGYGDYAVGAPTSAGGGRANAGSVYIVLGRAGAATIDLTNPGPGTTRIAGPGINSYCGTSVAAAGDVNGDGINDLLVGCPGMDTRLGALTQRGSAYLVYGSTSPQDIDLASIGTRGFAITGPSNSYVIGLPLLLSQPHVFGEHLRGTPQDATSVTQDVNGDGLADIVIGDSAVARNGQGAVGVTYVIFGKADNATVDANNLGTAGFVVRGAGENALSGYSAAIVGDVTGDTLADIVVGAPARGATAQPAAYLISGANSSADVDLAASAGRAVKMTAGADRLGVDATPLGDTDLDGKPDFALATSDGAYIVRTPPRSDRQLTSTDGYAVSGPTNQPLLSTLIPATSVGAAGDVDQDGRADLAIGYPDASGNGRGYVVQSPEASRTLDVAALPGQRGVALAAGSQTDRSGASIAGAGPLAAAGTSDAAHTILGAPNAAPSLRIAGGQAYVMPAASDTQPAGFAAQATASSSSSNGCYNGRETPFPFEVRNDEQFRYGYRVAANPNGTATYGQALAVLPRCRQTIKREIDRVPTGFRKASLDYRNRPLNDAGGSSAERTWAIRDSFNDAFATVRQTTAVESGKRVIKRWEVIRRNADGSDGDVVLNSTPNGLTSVTVQGYACFVAGESTDRVMIAVRPGSSGGAGVRGFIDRSALKSNFVSDSRLEKGDTGCRSDRGLNAPLSNPSALESQNLSTEAVGQQTVPLVYQGKSSALNVCPENYTRLDCGARYDSYEPPTFPGIKIMALSSTGISGGDNASRAGGGVAMAVVRANAGSFARLDRLGYNDPNVPCGRTPRVRWVFGNANPGRGKRGAYGWVPELASTQQPARTCPPPG